MNKILHIAKANILRHKGAALSLFVIIAIVAALATISLSVLLETEKDYYAGLDRLHSLHSVIFMPRDLFEPSFGEIIKNDPRVTEYEILDVLSAGGTKINYGGQIDLNVIIADIDVPLRISSPKITELDDNIPPENAIYLPLSAKNRGYKTGDLFKIVYMNKLYEFTITGFYESNELTSTNELALKFYVSHECYQRLSGQLPRYTWTAIRFDDPDYSIQFNRSFLDKTGISSFILFGAGTFVTNIEGTREVSLQPLLIISAIILVFSLVIALISLVVIRFRVTNSIEDTLHEIGSLKASGYTSAQITLCYIAEYSIMALPAALLGVIITIPAFGFFRYIFATITGFGWTFGANLLAGFLAAFAVIVFLLLMVFISCGRIKKLAPVEALRGGIASNNFRRNFFPLGSGLGNVHLRLGLKNMLAHFKLYAMIGVIIMGICTAVTIIYVMYYNFAIDNKALIRMAGVEVSDMSLSLIRNVDAYSFAAELEKMPEVRKTSMMEWVNINIDGYNVMCIMSDDYGQMEILKTHTGRLPKYDNELAVPKRFANILGKQIGDCVLVKANGVLQEFVITGFYSTLNNGGMCAAVTMEGYQQFVPNAKRSNINVYLNEGAEYSAFVKKLEDTYGVLNKYRLEENSKYAAARARAEEKISTYLEKYAIDSIEYAVIYNGEIILRGSSDAYWIKTIVNMREFLETQIGSFTGIISAVMQLVALVSIIILSLILYMTVRSIVAKRRRELGILKSGGYTTKQLARQLAISFIPAAGAGAIIGCTLGMIFANPTLEIMFASAGIYNAEFTINPIAITVIGALILLVTFTAANISALRIRHISVYELISE